MISRGLVWFPAVALAATVSVTAEEAKTYSGTFKDTQGREGPLVCSMTPKDGGKVAVRFKAKNTGKGPNRDMDCAGELSGKAQGAKMELSGEITLQRQGPIAVTASLEDKSLKATFKSKDGKTEGNFDLTLGEGAAKAPAPAAEPAAKKQAEAPKSN